MFSSQQKVVISCAKNSPAVKKSEAKNAQLHVHGVTKRRDIKQESIYSIGTFVHSFSICFTLLHPARPVEVMNEIGYDLKRQW